MAKKTTKPVGKAPAPAGKAPAPKPAEKQAAPAEKLFTGQSYVDYINQKKLMGAKCKDCGKINLPPRIV